MIEISLILCYYIRNQSKGGFLLNYSQRKDSILSMLRVAEELSIRQLTDMTGASDATIRRDLARMEQEGCVRRSWGGVCRPDTPENTRRSSLQRQTLSSAHEVIGKAAASFLKDEELIFIGSGTTPLSMIPYIQNKRIHVITNGIPQLEALQEKGIQTLLLCGFFKEYSRSLVGKETVNMLRSYHFDRAFLGVNGLDQQLNLLSADEYEDSIKTISIHQSRRTYLMCDHRKFGRTAFYLIPHEYAKDVTLITDQPNTPSGFWQEREGACIARLGDLSE